MDIERERGISITSAALEFELHGCRVTLLDTPGHKDFSEDTYRTLLAADSVVMVIDAAKGIETQTRKLFEVASRRKLPMLTFVNKLDLPGRDPLDLLDEIERVLGVSAAPMNWPIGTGDRFKGVYDLRRAARCCSTSASRAARGARPVTVTGADDPHARRPDRRAGARRTARGRAPARRPPARTSTSTPTATAQQTPVFFGSALTNFGLESFLEALVQYAPCPQPRPAEDGTPIDPLRADFSGFVFKIQANMNPRHRDRVAFVRVCSGVLTQGHAGRQHAPARRRSACRGPAGSSGAIARRSRRRTPATSSASSIPDASRIGDTLYAGTPVVYPPIPHFPAEHFGALKLQDVRFKQFDDGVRQLEEEGLMQVVFPVHGARYPILGVVGALQFDIIEARMREEYGVACRAEKLSYVAARWVQADANARLTLPNNVLSTTDRSGRRVLLFPSEWDLQFCERENPKVQFLSMA